MVLERENMAEEATIDRLTTEDESTNGEHRMENPPDTNRHEPNEALSRYEILVRRREDEARAEEDKRKEKEKDPELEGKIIARKIIALETKLKYEERYNEQNGPYIDKLYRELKECVSLIKQQRHNQDDWDPSKEYEKPDKYTSVEDAHAKMVAEISEANKTVTSGKGEETIPTDQPLPDRSLGELRILSRATGAEEVASDLSIYFKKAKDIGLLKEVDAYLASFYMTEVEKATSPGKVLKDMEDMRSYITKAGIDKFYSLRKGNSEIDKLAEVWEPYIDLAFERFRKKLFGEESADYIPGEFQLAGEENESQAESKDLFWVPSPHYPDYYIVTASTPEEFNIAKDTFLQMVKGGAIGHSPDKILQHMENFAKALGHQGVMEGKKGFVTEGFMEELRQEFEGVSYIYGADYSNETYNAEQAHAFGNALALHEGPQRWIRLARSGQGQVGAFLWKWDKDPRMTLFHNPSGSRGQIGNDTITQHFLQAEIKRQIIEEAIGIQLKNYDTNLNMDSPEAKLNWELNLDRIQHEIRNGKKVSELSKLDQGRYNAGKNNLERIGLHQNDDLFKNLYEGFDKGDANIKNYQRFKDIGADQLDQLPPNLKRSVALGRIQTALSEGKPLSKEDQELYDAAYKAAASNFEVAFQMVGVTGEKVRRGGGLFFVDKNPYIQTYRRLQFIPDKKLTSKQRLTRERARVLILLRNNDRKIESLTDEDKKIYQEIPVENQKDVIDYMPVYQAEKFVQFAETWTKIKYGDDAQFWKDHDPKTLTDKIAQDIRKKNREEYGEKGEMKNFKAQYRAEKTKAARIQAGYEIQRKGFEAKLYDEDGKPMMLKRPKINPDGSREVEEVEVDFNIAIDHIYSRWTSHTYWGYQPENRHMLLDPEIFAAAKRIRNGESRPEDEDMLATQLLITDPTLCRVKAFPGDQMQKEITLLQAAVEESYQGHWRIDRNMHRLFLPPDGNPDMMRMGYLQEDYGGISRFVMRCRDLIATQPKRYARRMGARIADIPMEVSSMPDIWGQEGVLGAVGMFADQIDKVSEQKAAGQFALTKFNDQLYKFGPQLFNAFVGQIAQDGGVEVDVEGLLEKPTNNSDKLQKFRSEMFSLSYPQFENDMFYAYKQSFERLEKVLQIMRKMESSVRNAQGALLLEKVDIFLPDGSFNPDIADDRSTGSSRHSEKIFYDTYIHWLISTGKGGGVEAYPDDAPLYAWLQNIITADEKKKRNKRKISDWLFDKMGR